MLIFLFIIIIFIPYNSTKNKNLGNIIKKKSNDSQKNYYDFLFNSIENDLFNLSEIYNNSYNSIKIKHKFKNNLLNKEICVFGVLVNDKGLKLEKSMLEWLLEEYDIYCIYQKYPGKLYEYPALRFAQWFSIMYNISIILYIHTKGAYHKSKLQDDVIDLWRHEFTSPRKFIYINCLKNNLSEICLPYREGTITFFNGMFISNKAFKLIDEILYESNRFYYEELLFFNKKNIIRIKGLLNDSVPHDAVIIQNALFLEYFKSLEILNSNRIKITIILFFLIFIFSLKRIYLKKIKKYI